MRRLEKERGPGRDDYPVRGTWNAVLAGVVYEHKSMESLRRELLRNAHLRDMCGLSRVPTSWAFSKFLRKPLSMEEELSELLPDFGVNLAVDGKAIKTHARPHKKEEKKTPDGRRDTDADFGRKDYRGQREDGTLLKRSAHLWKELKQA